MIYTGNIEFPDIGVYTFSVQSNDGSRLFIDDNLVVENDGWHGMYEKEGEMALSPGLHKLQLNYFQAGGGKELKACWVGPGVRKQKISSSELMNK